MLAIYHPTNILFVRKNYVAGSLGEFPFVEGNDDASRNKSLSCNKPGNVADTTWGQRPLITLFFVFRASIDLYEVPQLRSPHRKEVKSLIALCDWKGLKSNTLGLFSDRRL